MSGALLAQLIFFIMCLPSIRASLFASIDPVMFKQMLRFGLPLVAGGFAFWGMASIDRFLLNRYSNLSELAVYSMAVSFASVGSILTSVFGTIWHPLVYRWSLEGVEPARFQRVLDLTVLSSAVLWTFSGLFSWVIAFLLPTDYEQVVWLLPLCLSVPLLYLISEVTQIGINLKRKTVYAMIISAAALALNVLINITWLAEFGALAAALASAAAFTLFLIGRTEVSSRLLPLFSRASVYLVLMLFLVASVIFAVWGRQSLWMPLLWLVPFALTLMLYKSVVSEVYALLLKRFR